MRRMSCGFGEPSVSWSPGPTLSPSFTRSRRLEGLGTGISSSLITRNSLGPDLDSTSFTRPAASARGAACQLFRNPLVSLDDGFALPRGDHVLDSGTADDTLLEGHDHIVALLDRHHRH